MSKRLLGIGDVYTYDYKQVHKTRNVGFGYYDPNKVSTTSSTDEYVLVDGVLCKVNEMGSSSPEPTPPTPQLPPYTIRLKYKEGTTPTFSKGTGVLVDADNNIWDLTYEDNNWGILLEGHHDLLEVVDGNTIGVEHMEFMFYNCTSLTTVSLFDTSNVTNMDRMFSECHSLTSIPLFNTSNVTNMNQMFYYCNRVQSGALALYQQASSQAIPPTRHPYAFRDCGRDTQTGAAELAQIPSNWK